MGKVLLGVLIDSKYPTLLTFDNVNRQVTSAALASILTSRHYSGRALGENRMLTAPNDTIVTVTGNNLEFSSEIAKRTIPIRMRARTDRPEKRADFKHPNLSAHVAKMRGPVLSALLGAVELWKAAGRPAGEWRLGGFEAWARTVGGIMGLLRFEQWARNADVWAETADVHSADLRRFAVAMHQKYGTHCRAAAGDLADLAESIGASKGECDPKGDGKINPKSFQRRVLTKHQGAVVLAGLTLKQIRSGNNSSYCLVPLEQDDRANPRADTDDSPEEDPTDKTPFDP